MRSVRCAVALLSLIACTSTSEAEDDVPAPTPRDAGAREEPTEDTKSDAGASGPTKYGSDAGAYAEWCKGGPSSTAPVGRRCGLVAAVEDLCSGELEPAGFLYECEDEGGQVRRPQGSCRQFDRYTYAGLNITRFICEAAVCTPYADERCGVKEGWACPDPTKPNVPSPPPPVPAPLKCESLGSWWRIDNAQGPLLCCG